MNREEKEHLEFMEQSEKITLEGFKKLTPYMANEHNPMYVAAVKGTPLEKMNTNTKIKLGNVIEKVYSDRYKAIRDAWLNVFGRTNIHPFKKTNKVIIEEFMNDVFKDKEKAFAENYAEDWLRNKYLNEIKKGR
tara:strand:+ start:1473 stop:1874 length:402 start_codon:yes stop_codon:yes gene_type:complete